MSISGLALSRVTHQAFGALEAVYGPIFMCVHARIFMCCRRISPFLQSTLSFFHRHTHTNTHVPAWQVQVCDRLGVLGTGHPHRLSLSS